MVNTFLHCKTHRRFADRDYFASIFVCGRNDPPAAGVAQLVEQLICNHQVVSSSLITGSILNPIHTTVTRNERRIKIRLFCVLD